MRKNSNRFYRRLLTVFLAAALACPSPALALRPSSPVQSGTEETLKTALSNRNGTVEEFTAGQVAAVLVSRFQKAIQSQTVEGQSNRLVNEATNGIPPWLGDSGWNGWLEYDEEGNGARRRYTLEKWVDRNRRTYLIRLGPLIYIDRDRTSLLRAEDLVAPQKQGIDLFRVKDLTDSVLSDHPLKRSGRRVGPYSYSYQMALHHFPDWTGKLLVEAGIGRGEPSLIPKVPVVGIELNPERLNGARENFMANGRVEGRDFFLIQADIADGAAVQAALRQVKAKLDPLGLPVREIVLASDIGTYPGYYNVTNETSIGLISLIEEALGMRVSAVIGGGVNYPGVNLKTGTAGNDIRAAEGKGFLFRGFGRFWATPSSLGSGLATMDTMSWIAQRAAGTEEPAAEERLHLGEIPNPTTREFAEMLLLLLGMELSRKEHGSGEPLEVAGWLGKQPRVLDLGPGLEGGLIRWLRKMGAPEVYGFDKVFRSSDLEADRYLRRGVFQDRWPFDDRWFSLVVSSFALNAEEIPAGLTQSAYYPRVLAELARVLKEDGLAVLVVGGASLPVFEAALTQSGLGWKALPGPVYLVTHGSIEDRLQRMVQGIASGRPAAGTEEVSVEAVPTGLDFQEARRVKAELSGFFKQENYFTGESTVGEILDGHRNGIVVVARKGNQMVGLGVAGLGLYNQKEASIVSLLVGRKERAGGIGTAIFQKLLWGLADRFPDLMEIVIIDGSRIGQTGNAALKFSFHRSSSDPRFLRKEISFPKPLMDLRRDFPLAADFLGAYWEKMSAVQRETARQFINQHPDAQAVSAAVDLTQIPVFVQGYLLYEETRLELRSIYKGILFRPERIPEPDEEPGRFQWSDVGIVLQNAMLQPAPNPKGLPVRAVYQGVGAVAALDPMDLLAEIFRDRLGIPRDHRVEAFLFSDQEGRARLVLLHAA